jgi:hypothetical protein
MAAGSLRLDVLLRLRCDVPENRLGKEKIEVDNKKKTPNKTPRDETKHSTRKGTTPTGGAES